MLQCKSAIKRILSQALVTFIGDSDSE